MGWRIVGLIYQPLFGIVFKSSFGLGRLKPFFGVKGYLVFEASFQIPVNLFGYSESETLRGDGFQVVIIGSVVSFPLPKEAYDPFAWLVFALCSIYTA
jgi:hypothetical protein